MIPGKDAYGRVSQKTGSIFFYIEVTDIFACVSVTNFVIWSFIVAYG